MASQTQVMVESSRVMTINERSEKEKAKMISQQDMSSKEIEIIQKNWVIVSEDLQGAGLTLFRRLFEQYPQVMGLFYFASKNEIDLEKTMEDRRLKSHARKVMDTLSVAVSNLHDLDTLVPALKQLGAKHGRFHLREEHFEAVGSSLLWTLEQRLGQDFNQEACQAWKKLFGFVAKNMIERATDKTKQG